MAISTFSTNKPFVTQLADYLAGIEFDGLLLLPSKRSCGTLTDLLKNKYSVHSLPTIIALGEFADHPYAQNILKNMGREELLTPPISSIKRQLILTQLCMATAKQQNQQQLSMAQALDLATALTSLLDEFQRQEVDLSTIQTLAPEEYATHWQHILQFLNIITHQWPNILTEELQLDPITRRNLIYQAVFDYWQTEGLQEKVIIAGSTASNDSVARLMQFIAGHNLGEVILPALPVDCDKTYWDSIDASHPYFYTKQFLKSTKKDLKDVTVINTDTSESCETDRSAFIHHSLAPSNMAHLWQQAGHYQLDGMEFIQTPNELEQAQQISLICHQLSKEKQSICIVSEKKSFTKLLTTALTSQGLGYDASEGGSLKENPWSAFFQLILQTAMQPMNAAYILALFKHPLCKHSDNSLELIYWLEKNILRTGRVYGMIEHLVQTLQAHQAEEAALLIPILENYHQTIDQLSNTLTRPSSNLSSILKLHITVMQGLAEQDTYHQEKVQFDEFIEKLNAQANYLGQADTKSYQAILDKFITAEHIPNSTEISANIRILPSEEARLETADAMIIANFNEDIWPATATANPWLSRAMQQTLGMDIQQMRASRMAHDFMMLSHAKQLFLVHSLSDKDSITMPSRWQQRISFHLLANKQIQGAQDLYSSEYANQLSKEKYSGKTKSADPPAPTPPPQLRPNKLSISDVELLQRDPYSIYAKHILKLKPLEELNLDSSHATYGMVLHKILELFCCKYQKELQENAMDELESITLDTLHAFQIDENLHTLWLPRIRSTLEHYYHTELERRPTISKVDSEMNVSSSLQVNNKSHQLYGRIDRVEHYNDNSAAIVDYKTGGLPLVREVKNFTAAQLPLSAWLVSKQSSTAIDKVEYWKLSANECQTKPQLTEMLEEDTLSKIEAHILELFSYYDDESTPYEAIPDPDIAPKYSAYDQLERVGEWG